MKEFVEIFVDVLSKPIFIINLIVFAFVGGLIVVDKFDFGNLTKRQRLRNALNANDFRQAKQLLDAGVNPNAHHGELLITAVCNHNFGAAKLLIDNGADVNLEDGRILSDVVDSCSKDERYCAVRFLLDNGADVHTRNEHALFEAFRKKDYPLMSLLLERGADVHVNHESLLYSAMKWRDLKAIQILLEHGADLDALDTLLDYYTETMPGLKEILGEENNSAA